LCRHRAERRQSGLQTCRRTPDCDWHHSPRPEQHFIIIWVWHTRHATQNLFLSSAHAVPVILASPTAVVVWARGNGRGRGKRKIKKKTPHRSSPSLAALYHRLLVYCMSIILLLFSVDRRKVKKNKERKLINSYNGKKLYSHRAMI